MRSLQSDAIAALGEQYTKAFNTLLRRELRLYTSTLRKQVAVAALTSPPDIVLAKSTKKVCPYMIPKKPAPEDTWRSKFRKGGCGLYVTSFWDSALPSKSSFSHFRHRLQVLIVTDVISLNHFIGNIDETNAAYWGDEAYLLPFATASLLIDR